MIVEKQMECRLAGETEVLGENLPQRHFCPSQNPTLPDPGLNPGRRGGKPATNCLSNGVAHEQYNNYARGFKIIVINYLGRDGNHFSFSHNSFGQYYAAIIFITSVIDLKLCFEK
jgi:hypothetical protein